MTEIEKLRVQLGAYNEILEYLRRAAGKTEAMERLEDQRDRLQFDLKQVERRAAASRGDGSLQDTPRQADAVAP